MAGISSGRTKRKVIVTRDMGPDANALLESSEQWPSLEVHRWEEDRPAPRDWILQRVWGATALLITLCDKARPLLSKLKSYRTPTFSPQVDEELLRAGAQPVYKQE